MTFKVPIYTVEGAAAKLWQHDHPTMSVFACDEEMKDAYRKRVRVVIAALGLSVDDFDREEIP